MYIKVYLFICWWKSFFRTWYTGMRFKFSVEMWQSGKVGGEYFIAYLYNSLYRLTMTGVENGSLVWYRFIHKCLVTAQKIKFSFQDFFSKCDQVRRKLRKSLIENFIFLCSEGYMEWGWCHDERLMSVRWSMLYLLIC